MSDEQHKTNKPGFGSELDDLLANPFATPAPDEDSSMKEKGDRAQSPSAREAEADANEDMENQTGKNDTPAAKQENTGEQLIEALPEENKEQAREIAEQIDPTDHEAILAFGTAAQSKLDRFSHSMLDHVQKKDIGEIGEVLRELMKKLEQSDPSELQGEKRNMLSRWFGKMSGSLNETLSKYQKIGAQLDRISVKLSQSKDKLLDDIQLLDQLYEQNKAYFYALNVYIAAARVKLDELHRDVIPALKKKAEQTNDQMTYQEANDMMQFANRLEKRIHDLQLSRQVTIQSAPQIRLIQQTNQALTEKIQSSIMTAIPLWKNQLTIALTLLRQRKALEAQKQVTNTTNEMLRKNADMLKTNTVETARENERGFVDIETLKHTQQQLISTVEETMSIQQEGREKRAQAEKELRELEGELKQTLLAHKK